MKYHTLAVSLFLIVTTGLPALALDSGSPLGDTQEVLTTPAEREKALKKFPKAQQADSAVNNLSSNPKTKEMVYQMSAEILQTIAVKAEGDPKEMQKMMDEAQSNPEAFYNSLDPLTQARIRGVANDIQKEKGISQPPN